MTSQGPGMYDVTRRSAKFQCFKPVWQIFRMTDQYFEESVAKNKVGWKRGDSAEWREVKAVRLTGFIF